MKTNEELLNLKKFHSLTKERWANEPLEFFKCSSCNWIVVGIPDCHIVLTNPSDLRKRISYNLPRRIRCPNCNIVWYDGYKVKKYKIEYISLEELILSDWGKIFSKK